jgi:hypothetical protein
MRDLHSSELGFVYGAGGGGKSCAPKGGKGNSKAHSTKAHSTKRHSTKRHSTRGGSRCG